MTQMKSGLGTYPASQNTIHSPHPFDLTSEGLLLKHPKIYLACIEGLQVFKEVIDNLSHTLNLLGYETELSLGVIKPNEINIVFCMHMLKLDELKAQGVDLNDIIIYNLEQVGLGVQWMHHDYFELLRHCHVWEYSDYNFQQLKNLGAPNIELLPICYSPILTNLPIMEEDIDVFFYGTMSARREACLDAMQALGINVVSTRERPYLGKERDEMIARSKIVLNMHFYENAHIFEVVRVSHLLANSKVVVSELGAHTAIEADIKEAIVHGSIQALPELCLELLNDEARRKQIGQKGFEIMKKRDSFSALDHVMKQFVKQRQAKQERKILFANHQNHGKRHDENRNHYILPEHHSMPLPKRLQVGARYWRYDCLNVDHRPQFQPDLLLNMGEDLPFGEMIDPMRFGLQTLPENYFEEIVSDFGFEEIANLDILMKNCMRLLQPEGVIKIKVHHEFSEGFARNPYAKQRFNETSFTFFVTGNRMRDFGWYEYIFRLDGINYGISEFGQKLLKQNGHDEFFSVRHTPRTIDAIEFTLKKVPSRKEDKMMAKNVAIFDTRYGD